MAPFMQPNKNIEWRSTTTILWMLLCNQTTFYSAFVLSNTGFAHIFFEARRTVKYQEAKILSAVLIQRAACVAQCNPILLPSNMLAVRAVHSGVLCR